MPTILNSGAYRLYFYSHDPTSRLRSMSIGANSP